MEKGKVQESYKIIGLNVCMNNANIKEQIIDYLKKNRVSTTEVADALGKQGIFSKAMPVNRGFYVVGETQWIYAYDQSNWPIHEQIQNMNEDKVILVEAFECNNRALFGELVSKYLMLYRQSRAIVVDGKLRDAAALIRQNWPIWCNGFTPIGCYNIEPSNVLDSKMIQEHMNRYNGAIAVCDDCGVVVIGKENINNNFLAKLSWIEEQEDIWFDRLDRYKENTFEIVCKKKYLSDNLYMSGHESYSRYNNDVLDTN